MIEGGVFLSFLGDQVLHVFLVLGMGWVDDEVGYGYGRIFWSLDWGWCLGCVVVR